jgi:hypothetical protein
VALLQLRDEPGQLDWLQVGKEGGARQRLRGAQRGRSGIRGWGWLHAELTGACCMPRPERVSFRRRVSPEPGSANAHAARPAVVVGGLAPEVLGCLGEREDQEALLVQPRC